MNAEHRAYLIIIALLGLFALTIYGAYTPARKAQKQQIICIKFKPNVSAAAVEQHMNGFASLKNDVPQIIGYTSGKTILPNQATSDYDVVHYLTFQSVDDIKTFEESAAFQAFVKQNRVNWASKLLVNADIQP